LFIYIYDTEKDQKRSVEIDELVARITAFNVRSDFLPETIKAFAIMARTDVARRLDIYGGKGCDNHKDCNLCTMPGHCLEYGFSDVIIPKEVTQAVEETKNKIILFEGRAIKPYFHYRCGGATENSENVIGSRITYIRKVLCAYCQEIPDNAEDKVYTIEQLEKLLNTKIAKSDDLCSTIKGIFEDIEVDDQNRVKSLKVGSKTFKGYELMNILDLNSTRFHYAPVKFLIKSIGTGHGLGLCQCGANEMAKLGKSYDDILKYYYTGVQIEAMEFPEEGKPLKGKKMVLDAAFGGYESKDNMGPTGLREKDVNLDITLKLKNLLEKDGASVVLTREDDRSLTMAERANISNEARPNFFLSIQQNGLSHGSASGTEIYHYRDDDCGEELSKRIINEISTELGTKNRGVRIGDYFLLREVKSTSIILQLLYITDARDEKLLADEDFRTRAAVTIYKAISKYYEK